MIAKVSHIHQENGQANRAVFELSSKINEILRVCPLLDGVLLEGVQLANGSVTRIPHKLRRKPRGWIVVDMINATGTSGQIQRSQSDSNGNTPDETQQLWLTAGGFGAVVTVSLWIF